MNSKQADDSVLINPYKKPGEEQLCRKIIADVGVYDWDKVYRRVPYRGFQDHLFGSLFHAFAQEAIALDLEPAFDPRAEHEYHKIIQRLALSRTDRD